MKKDFRIILDSRISFWYYVLLGGSQGILSKYSHMTITCLSFRNIKKRSLKCNLIDMNDDYVWTLRRCVPEVILYPLICDEILFKYLEIL